MINKISAGKDYGNDFPFKCSTCDSQGFDLVKLAKKGGFAPFQLAVRIFLMGEEKWILRCSACGLEFTLKNTEVEEVRAVFEKYESFAAGDLSKEEFIEIVKNSEAPTIKELYIRSQSWKCPDCETDIPMTFETCWNCDAECPNPEEILSIDAEISLSDSAMFGSTFTVIEKGEQDKE